MITNCTLEVAMIFICEIVNFGNGKEVMEEIGISESAIKYDYEPVMLSKLNSMLGSVRALPINEYIVMFNNDTKDILTPTHRTQI